MSDVLSFVAPPPGLAPLTEFSLDEVAGAGGLYSLRALGDETVRLFVLDAAVFVPDYAPELSDEQCEALGVGAPEDAIVLVVANPGDAGTSMNLMAPIVVNAKTRVSAQVILEDQDWPLRAELGRAS